jgi:hypothetical protein
MRGLELAKQYQNRCHGTKRMSFSKSWSKKLCRLNEFVASNPATSRTLQHLQAGGVALSLWLNQSSRRLDAASFGSTT